MSLARLENKIDSFLNHKITILSVIIIIGLFLRIYFTNWDVPVRSPDTFLFLIEGLEFSGGNFEHFGIRSLWPIFLSFFFLIFKFDDYHGYMTMMRVITIIVSVSSIPVLYLIAREYVNEKYAFFAAGIFSFDPSILENSLLPIREPIFILLGLLSYFFLINKNERLIPFAFLFAGLAFDARLNGISLFLIAIVACVLRVKPKVKLLSMLLVGFGIFLAISSPHIFFPLQQEQIPFLMHFFDAERTVSNVEVFPATYVESEPPSSEGILKTSLVREFIHLGKIGFPYLMILAPLGLFVSMKNFDYKKKILLTAIITSFIIAYPMYFKSAEYRNLLLITPFLCIFASIGIQRYLFNFKFENILLIVLLFILLLSSFIFLTLTISIDKESLVEKEQIAKYIINNFSGRVMGDLYLQISHNIPNAEIGDSAIHNERFAITIQEFPIDTKDKLIDVSKKLRVDYLIIDDEADRRYPIFDDIFKHETDYPFLEKVFDSDQTSYQKIHVKIFKIKPLEEG